MRVAAIIQARNSSTRLPDKVLRRLADKTVLEHVVERVRRCPLVEEVLVATTINPRDLSIVRLCADAGIRVFCGSEGDVLDRFYQLAKLLEPDHVVRITADCPLMDPAVIGRIIEAHLSGGVAYTSNVEKPTFPDGEDVEIFTFGALKQAWKDASLTSEREHVTPFIRNRRDLFSRISIEDKEDHSSLRWTLDNPEDFLFLTAVFDSLYSKDPQFGMEDVLELLRRNPELQEVNAKIQRNEGLAKSIREDKVAKKGED